MAHPTDKYPGSLHTQTQRQLFVFRPRIIQIYFVPANDGYVRHQEYFQVYDAIPPVGQPHFLFQMRSHCPHPH